MNEYITKSAAIAAIGNHQCDYLNSCYEQDCLAIANLPAADVTPIKHGKWSFFYSDWERVKYLECSICKRKIRGQYHYPYCPNCGAKMDGGNNS